jgi:hypothetical protein
MPLRRRRALPPELAVTFEAFRRCAEHVDLGQRAVIRCVPSSARAAPLPLDVGAETLRTSLAEAARLLPEWRHPAVDEVWRRCEQALADTTPVIDLTVASLRSTTELEVALTAVQNLLDPLHAFVDAERTFAALRQKQPRPGADSR